MGSKREGKRGEGRVAVLNRSVWEGKGEQGGVWGGEDEGEEAKRRKRRRRRQKKKGNNSFLLLCAPRL